MVLMTIGKKAISAVMMSLGSMPNPNQTTSSGAIATFGMIWAATIAG